MVQIIAGKKGKGKTKYLLEKANEAVRAAAGTIVYLDKSSKHMYELSNRIRLINVNEYGVVVNSADGFLGFLCGIISQDHDLEIVFLDSFLKLAGLEGEDITEVLNKLENISEKYHTKFVLSISLDSNEIPESYQKCIITSL